MVGANQPWYELLNVVLTYSLINSPCGLLYSALDWKVEADKGVVELSIDWLVGNKQILVKEMNISPHAVPFWFDAHRSTAWSQNTIYSFAVNVNVLLKEEEDCCKLEHHFRFAVACDELLANE